MNYKLKCEVVNYIKNDNSIKNRVVSLLFGIINSNNMVLFSTKIDYVLFHDFLNDDIWIMSDNTVECFLKHLIKSMMPRESLKKSKQIEQQRESYWYYPIDYNTWIRFVDNQLQIIIKKNTETNETREENVMRNLNFKLNNNSKKQFIQESKNAIIKLRQSTWKHILNKEINHYCTNCEKNNLCSNCKSLEDREYPLIDNEFTINTFF